MVLVVIGGMLTTVLVTLAADGDGGLPVLYVGVVAGGGVTAVGWFSTKGGKTKLHGGTQVTSGLSPLL